MNFKEINIGELIENRVTEIGLEMPRICTYLKLKEQDILKIYQTKSIDSEIILQFSKLLEYDFFRIYSQHLILYAPFVTQQNGKKEKKTSLPQFRKNIYTKEVIYFILKLIKTGKKTKLQIIKEYQIPKTTLYKWISKYENVVK